jgi:uncharacterized protein (DUF58 family)
MRYRVTSAGLLFLLALILTGLGAFLTGNNLLFLIFAAMMALLLVSGFLSRLVISGLELELHLPEHVSAGTPTPARILVRNLKRITPSFSIELTGAGIGQQSSGQSAQSDCPVYLPLLPGGATVEAPLEIVFPRRGRHRESLFLLSTKFPFGFIRRTTPVALHRETIVYPNLDHPQPGIELLLDSIASQLAAQSRGAGREFHSIRAYETLDDVRHIDWKSTAHTGSLQVREFARDRQSMVEIHFDRRISQNESPAFEDLIEQCASLAWNLYLRNIDLCFNSQDFTWDGGDIYDILVFLSLVEPVDSMDLAMMELSPDDSTLQVIFSTHVDALRQSAPASAHLIGPRSN